MALIGKLLPTQIDSPFITEGRGLKQASRLESLLRQSDSPFITEGRGLKLP